MSRQVLFSICALVILLWGPHNAHAAQFADFIRAGLDAEDAGNLDDAINQFSEAIKMHGNSAQCWAKRGEVYLKKGDPQSAIKDLTQAVKLDPAYAAAFTRLGFAYNAVNDYDSAIDVA